MNRHGLRVLVGTGLAAVLAQSSLASFNFSWSAPAQVNLGETYAVRVDTFFAPSNPSDHAVVYLSRPDRGVIGAGSCNLYSWTSVQQPSMVDTSVQTVVYRAEVTSYYGDYGLSTRSVAIVGVNRPRR